MELRDFDMDEPLTCEVVAERIGARRSLVVRLARAGVIETLESESSEPLLPSHVVVKLRRFWIVSRWNYVTHQRKCTDNHQLVGRFIEPDCALVLSVVRV